MSFILSKLGKGVEQFGNYSSEGVSSENITILDVLILLVSFYAAYLSWSCNKGVSLPLKIVYAFFAFLFGSLYVIFYGVFKGTFQPCKQ
jgi:CHASE2 domain-containing sensor protein